MGRVFTFIFILAAWLTPASASAAPPEPAGVVKDVDGRVTIVRGGQSFKAASNTLIFEGDVVVTGFSGRAGLILEDDTILSLGRRSKLVLAQYVNQPEDDKLALVLRLIRGTALFISGKIGKLAPDAIRIETPHAVIGVRGSQLMIEVD